MRVSTTTLVLFAVALTLLPVGLWISTGRDAYTKFEVIEEVQKPVDPNDPFAATGLYDGNAKKEVVRRPAFRFGLLPTPSGIFDKHVFSVVTVAGPIWVLAFVAIFARRRSLPPNRTGTRSRELQAHGPSRNGIGRNG